MGRGSQQKWCKYAVQWVEHTRGRVSILSRVIKVVTALPIEASEEWILLIANADLPSLQRARVILSTGNYSLKIHGFLDNQAYRRLSKDTTETIKKDHSPEQILVLFF
jgi:hypothetical protein